MTTLFDPTAEREDDLRLREAAVSDREAAVAARADIQAANEKLVLATLRADEMAEALRASEEQFRTLANTVPMLAWFANADGYIPWYNQRWFDYSGRTLDQLKGWGWESVCDPADRARVEQRWRDALRSGEPWEDVFRLRRHDGVFRWFLSRALPLRNSHGRIVRWFGTSADIDDQKRAEAESRAANRVKDEFLAMLGHELRNPLAPIQTALELMELRDPQASRGERTIIERQMRHLTQLVGDLLDVSRIAGGTIELRRHHVELADVVAQAAETTSPLFEKKRQQLNLDVALQGLAVHGDPDRLVQVVANLLTNASKYTQDQGTITVAAQHEGATVALRVRDNGIGISPDMLPKVFQLFSQEIQPIDRPRGGLGLGLTIVHSLVVQHGGTVEAHSAGLGQGSELVVRLPASEEQTARLSALRELTAARPGGSRRILVVDDNIDAAEVMGEALTDAGHEVRVAFDGPSALALVEAFEPEVALLDIGLPVMDGYELAARLHERLQPHPPRLIAVTGYVASHRPHPGPAVFDLHLLKPVSLATVVESIEQVLASA